jgi:predicted acetyltransferase
MDLRPIRQDELGDFIATTMSAFHRELSDEDREHYASAAEVDRYLAWFDGGRIVATSGAFTREVTVPGAVVRSCAVTAVGVRPTHRRRGLLTGLMRAQLDDLRERGDPIAILWSSEGAIYGRFGYGVAARAGRLVAHRPRARLARPAPGDPPLAAGPAAAFVEAMSAIYDRVRPGRPGMLDRRGTWWDYRLYDPERSRQGAQPLQAVVADDGYALYAAKPGLEEGAQVGEVLVSEVVAATPEARARIWAFLLDQDLTLKIDWPLAPSDEPLWLELTDPAAARMRLFDSLWVRIVDVPAALTARTYAIDPDVVIEVADSFCGWNAGRYRLAGGACEPTDAGPDLELDITDLGAAYLGGTTLAALAAAGRVRELSPGAVVRASRAFRGDVDPWCPETF